MLYDILPPVMFFTSLGGIVFIFGKVMLRTHKQNLVASASLSESDNLEEWRPLTPTPGKIRLVKSRFAALGDTFRVLTEWYKAHPLPIKSVLKVIGQGSQATRQKFIARLKPKPTPASSKPSPTTPPVASTPPIPQPRIKVRTITSTKEAPSSNSPMPAILSLGVRAKQPPQQKELAAAGRAFTAQAYQKAERILVPYIVEHTKDVHAYELLGEIALAQQKWDEAIEIFEQVVILNPQGKQGYAMLGLAAMKASKLAKALPALQRAHEADSTNEEILKQLLSIAQRLDNAALQQSITKKIAALH